MPIQAEMAQVGQDGMVGQNIQPTNMGMSKSLAHLVEAIVSKGSDVQIYRLRVLPTFKFLVSDLFLNGFIGFLSH